MDSDSPEDIAQKIYSITNIPVPYMSLFVRYEHSENCNVYNCKYSKNPFVILKLLIFIQYRDGYIHERLDAFTELQDNDVIRVVLRDPQELLQPQKKQYGKCSYHPVVAQTDLGMSKFYSILKFLVS